MRPSRNKYCGFFFPRQLTYIDTHVVYYGTDSQLSVHQIAIWHQFTNHFHILIQHLLDFFFFFFYRPCLLGLRNYFVGLGVWKNVLQEWAGAAEKPAEAGGVLKQI